MSGTTVINVKNPPYNAVGDGVADDTAAIQKAIAALGGSSGSVLYLPQGNYKVTQSLDFSNVALGQFRVIGDGQSLSKIEVAANNVSAIKFTGSGPTAPQVADIGFTVSTPSLTGTTAIALAGTSVTSYMSNAAINNVTITGYNTGIGLTDCLTNVITNVTVVSIPNSGTGVSLKLAGQTTLTNVVVGGGTSGSNATGFLVQGAPGTTSLGEGIFMNDCNANGPNIGLKIIDTHFGLVTGSSFTSCPGGGVVSVNTPGGIGTSAWSFSACEFNASTAPAVFMDPLASYNQFTGCFEFTSQVGIQLQGTNNNVTGNSFVLNTAGDILLDGAGGNNISGNVASSSPPAYTIKERARGTNAPFLNLITGNNVFTAVSPLVAGSGSIASNNLVETGSSTGAAGGAPCVAEGTRIATLAGCVLVENLRIGDRVSLADGGSSAVIWLGHRSVACRRHPRPWDVHPVRVLPDAFAPGMPSAALDLSPDHAVFVGGVLIPVRYLINGATIVQRPVDAITYWHVELERHAVLLAENLPAESYLDTGNRAEFSGATMTLHPDFARGAWADQGCAPLVTAGAKLRAARATLLHRAALLGHNRSTDPQAELWVRGRIVPPRQTAEGYEYILPPGAGPVTLRSAVAIPAHTHADHPDHRRLGLAVASLMLDGTDIDLADPRLGAGWHPPEPGLRWTDGDATISLGAAGRLTLRILSLLDYWRDDPGLENQRHEAKP